MLRTALLFIFTSLLSIGANASPESLEKEIIAYIKTFENNNSYQQVAAAKKLEWSGHSDTRLFDQIETKLLKHYKDSPNKATIDHMSWLCKSLAFSGNPKYLPTLEAVAAEGSHRKLKKYAKKSIALLPNYTKWNPQILDEKHWNPNWPNNLNRVQAMQQSSELALKRIAAKQVYSQHIQNEKILDQLEQQLLQNYQKEPNEKLFIDTWAWTAKALASSRKEQYHDTIALVASEANSKKLRKYAKRYQKDYINLQ